MEKITVIIPIHTINDEIKEMVINAINSVLSQPKTIDTVMVVGPVNVNNELEPTLTNLIKATFINSSITTPNITFINNEGDVDYCSQINLGVNNVKTKYFSILSFDDEYSPTWFKNVETYISDKPEYSIFLPIINFINKEKSPVGSMNEIVWAMSFSNEIGVIDEDALQTYYDFSVNGGVFRTDDFIDVGMLKPSIKLTFWYEFLLRATNQGLKVYVIPKNGYYQRIDRDDSMLNTLAKTMNESEREWWVKLATKEYYFKQERKKSYTYIQEGLEDVLS